MIPPGTQAPIPSCYYFTESMPVTRRDLLFALWPIAVVSSLRAEEAVQLEQFATGGPPCAPNTPVTRAVPRDATFKTGSPARASLIAATTAAGTPLTFAGTVTGLTCGRVAGARVDVWQADPAGVYDMVGFGLRGHQLTDRQGQFQFRTVMPGPSGRRAPHLGVNVKVMGKADFWTELFFPDDPRNASDSRFHQDLVVKLVPDGRTRRAHFDIVLDI